MFSFLQNSHVEIVPKLSNEWSFLKTARVRPEFIEFCQKQASSKRLCTVRPVSLLLFFVGESPSCKFPELLFRKKENWPVFLSPRNTENM